MKKGRRESRNILYIQTHITLKSEDSMYEAKDGQSPVPDCQRSVSVRHYGGGPGLVSLVFVQTIYKLPETT